PARFGDRRRSDFLADGDVIRYTSHLFMVGMVPGARARQGAVPPQRPLSRGRSGEGAVAARAGSCPLTWLCAVACAVLSTKTSNFVRSSAEDSGHFSVGLALIPASSVVIHALC